jgi:hypothetical protein
MSTTTKKGGCFGRSIITVIVVMLFACVICGGVAYVVAGPAIANVINAFGAPLLATNDFMNALVAKDYTKAYGLIHSSQQANFGGSADGLKQLITDKGLQPSTFSVTNIQISNSDALVNGTGTFGGASKYVYVNLSKDGETWKVMGLQVSDQAPTATPSS